MHLLEYFFIRLLYALFSRLPFAMARGFAHFMAFLLLRVAGYRKQVVIANLNRVYGNNWPAEPRRFLRDVYRHFVYLWMELLQTPRLNPATLPRHIQTRHQEVLANALAENKGVILLSGHLGNFEWINSGISLLGFPFAGVAKRQSNPYVDRFITNLRQKWGSTIIDTASATKEGLRFLKNGGILGLAADQYAGKKGVPVSMFGLETVTFVGPAIFHMRTGAPLVFIAAERTAYGKFTFHFERLECGPPDADDSKTIARILQCYNDALEKWIRRFPEQYFWTHRRWKNLETGEKR
ncbi:MAG: hypothetical protein D6677_05115 [Calditrichaeota bacterium]|nr:MAG: hypothetical protein D6677_05115 [Calditrichota bacterium]